MQKKTSVPKITQRMLEVFQAVVLHSGISAAARVLEISQPSVSRLIADLERSTQLKLFSHRGRGIVPTAQGVALYEQVDRAFVGLGDIARHAAQLRENEMGRLSVGCLPALGQTIMAQALATLRGTHPFTTVRLQMESSVSIAQMVAAMQIDIGFVAAAENYPVGVERIGRINGSCRCILPSNHPLAAETTITRKKINDLPFIALFGNSRVAQGLENGMRANGRGFNVVAEIKQSALASELVLKGMGISVVDPFVAAAHERRGGIVRNFSPSIEYHLDILAHSDSRLSETARALCDEIKRQTHIKK